MSHPPDTPSDLPTPADVLGLSCAELLAYQQTMGNEAVKGLLFQDVWTWEAQGEGRPSPWETFGQDFDQAA